MGYYKKSVGFVVGMFVGISVGNFVGACRFFVGPVVVVSDLSLDLPWLDESRLDLSLDLSLPLSRQS